MPITVTVDSTPVIGIIFFTLSFQQFSIVIAAFKYAHLMDGDLIELDQTFLLWHPLFNKHRIETLHIGEAYKFIDRGVIPDIAFRYKNSE